MAGEGYWSVIGSIATAVIAFFALCWTIFGERLWNRLHSPKLIMINHEPKGHPTEARDIRNPTNEPTPAWYLTPRIENKRPRTEAKGTRVRLVKFSVENKKGQFEDRILPAPLSFRWSSSPNTVQGSGNGTDTRTDLLTYDNFSLGYINGTTGYFKVQTEPDLFSVDSRVPSKRRARLWLEISASNFSPTSHWLIEMGWRENEEANSDQLPALPQITTLDSVKISL